MTNYKFIGKFRSVVGLKLIKNINSMTDNLKTQTAIVGYLQDNVITDFSTIPVEIRLSYLQETPKKFIKTRDIQGIKIPYIDHFYAERCLNFISNFRWGSEVIKSEIKEYEKKTTNGMKKVFEAIVEMKMWIILNEVRIERYIASGHTMYENPATTRADALQSAISKANTKFARQFGMGANIVADETKAYDRVEKYYVDGITVEEETKNNQEKLKAMMENGKVVKADTL